MNTDTDYAEKVDLLKEMHNRESDCYLANQKMTHSAVNRETYHISNIAEWFHVFPHVDITFSSVNATFDPNNSAYLEALGIIIAIPGFYLILTLLAFLIFFLCRCCDSSFKRKRKITPLKWTLGFFAILCCGALAVGLYGNETAHKGIGEIESSTRNISDVVSSVKNQSIKIESLLNDDVNQDLKKLDGLFNAISNETSKFFLKNCLDYLQDNVTIGSNKINDISHKVDNLNLQALPDIIDEVEFIRWPATIGLLCLLILLCLTLIWGVIKHSRCLLILFSVFGLLSVVICWVLVSMYVGICVAGSDFCLDPEPFLYQQANGVVETGVLTYYIHCDEKSQDPFNKAVAEGMKAMQNVKETLEQVNVVVLALHDNIQVIEETLAHLSDHVNQTEKLLNAIIKVVNCDHINAEYKSALESACTYTLEGTAFMLVSAVGSGLLFTVLIWVASHTWIHIRKKPPVEHVDEEDPFLPPTSSMSGARRNRETYGSTGFRPRSSHTPPQTPYFNMSLNGHGANHEDHNYLHGRYTPPPAYDQLSGGHLMGHVGSKMHYKA
ncbi:protein tweety homolog [Trichonephila inaurata madagascariensis]|uniref:Protein tweety homolog n=1 Tax=Trichonephila inaurata madagascariensis TaxID=2747483 RepID=A0A8X6YA73_9ARAC|nr:protein tweety homolog [Trichonephila inaurata madagascariensis]